MVIKNSNATNATAKLPISSGVLLIAKDRETARSLSHEFACGFAEKSYLAVGSGKCTLSSGIILSDMMRVGERGSLE